MTSPDRLSWWVGQTPEEFYATVREKFADSDQRPVMVTAQWQSVASVKAERMKTKRARQS